MRPDSRFRPHTVRDFELTYPDEPTVTVTTIRRGLCERCFRTVEVITDGKGITTAAAPRDCSDPL